jgi:hypothetical protein
MIHMDRRGMQPGTSAVIADAAVEEYKRRRSRIPYDGTPPEGLQELQQRATFN